jgi:hypothetical protein
VTAVPHPTDRRAARAGRFLLSSGTPLHPRPAGARIPEQKLPYAAPDSAWGLYGRSKTVGEQAGLRQQRLYL